MIARMDPRVKGVAKSRGGNIKDGRTASRAASPCSVQEFSGLRRVRCETLRPGSRRFGSSLSYGEALPLSWLSDLRSRWRSRCRQALGALWIFSPGREWRLSVAEVHRAGTALLAHAIRPVPPGCHHKLPGSLPAIP